MGQRRPARAIELNPKHEARFWAGVDKSAGPDGCWLWTRALLRGYGVFSIDAKNIPAHRTSLTIALGRPIRDGHIACHKRECPNKHCVNPAHLYEGTPRSNILDAAALGRIWTQAHPERRPYGELATSAKLTEADVVRIREMTAARPIPCHELAAQFGVGMSTIESALSGRSWSKAPGPIGKRIIPKPLGEKVPSAKLTPETVREIRALAAAGASQRGLGKRFGVHRATIGAILEGRTWGHVT